MSSRSGKARPFASMGATTIRDNQGKGNNVDHQTNGNRLAAWFSVGCNSVHSVDSDTTKARPFASIGATTIRKQPRQGNNIDHQTNGNRLAARFSVGSDSVHSEDSRSTKGNPSEERTHKSARRQPLSQERQRSGMGATKARAFRSLPLVVLCWLRFRSLRGFRYHKGRGFLSLPLGSLLALIPFPLRIPEAARPFASMEATPIRKQPRQGLSIFAAWVLRWLRFLSLRGFLHHQGRGNRFGYDFIPSGKGGTASAPQNPAQSSSNAKTVSMSRWGMRIF